MKNVKRPMLINDERDCLSGVAKLKDDRLIMLLDFNALFTDKELTALSKVEA